MKNLYSKLMMGFLLLSTSTINAQTTYCPPTWGGWSANLPPEPITLVQFGTGAGSINNPSADAILSTTPRYEDFSSISMNVQRGQTYDLKVKGNTDGNNTNYITVYFDWNGDGVFSNATPTNAAAQQQLTNQPEKHQHTTAIINSTGLDNIEMVHTVTIPTDAFIGSIRMRVVKNLNAPSPNPCSSPFSFGQVEDYTLNITNGSTTPVVCTDPGPNAGDTGCVTFTYDGVSKTLTTVRGADGNIWLQQNLGSTQVATSMTDTNSYGDIFQWGRWNDGHEKRTSTTTAVPTPNNPSGLTSTNTSFIIESTTDWWDGGSLTDTWSAVSSANTSATEGCDPCKVMGAGWVMPTETDWTGIKNAESISNPATAFASNLKLPASGFRSSSNGNYTFVDQRGYYWSSTTSTTGAKYFYIGSVIANPAAGAMRGQGHAVRCIYKSAVNVNTVTVTTQNNVAATITAVNGTLQLEATITPTTANQAVTWSVQSGNTSATVDNAGLVTGLTNGTAIIRATSVDDTTKFGELTVTVNIAASSDTFDTDKVKIYPNPTTGMFFIDTDISVKSIEIYNTSGQRILTTNQKNINLENAANGLYIVNVYAADGTHASYKIIKK